MNLTIVEDRAEVAERINSLHAEMTGHMSMAVKKAILIGELLLEQKHSLEHGEWIPWVNENLVFGDRQARKYMRVYTNRNSGSDLIDGASSINAAVSLLAESKEVEPLEQAIEYRDSDETVKKLNAQADTILQLEKDLEVYITERRRLQDEIESLRNEQVTTEIQSVDLESEEEIERLKKELIEANEELTRLESVKANEEHIKETLQEIQELKQKKSEMYADAESVKVVQRVLIRSREFFTREVMQIPALNLRPESVRVMQQDFKGLVELVENWLDAVKERFINE